MFRPRRSKRQRNWQILCPLIACLKEIRILRVFVSLRIVDHRWIKSGTRGQSWTRFPGIMTTRWIVNRYLPQTHEAWEMIYNPFETACQAIRYWNYRQKVLTEELLQRIMPQAKIFRISINLRLIHKTSIMVALSVVRFPQLGTLMESHLFVSPNKINLA